MSCYYVKDQHFQVCLHCLSFPGFVLLETLVFQGQVGALQYQREEAASEMAAPSSYTQSLLASHKRKVKLKTECCGLQVFHFCGTLLIFSVGIPANVPAEGVTDQQNQWLTQFGVHFQPWRWSRSS